ncbi:RimJ/RimL family protein N-acetyltransferase [Asanoa ferruginea]|uniref:RimJ/RimL family protein N-acetyltransferase n=1 Tax=Asanoa ferruginea TaxID=53367 RepID=A0A3D9ZKC1_9ACTN|nr:GNAT family N-acetyltransferase [Asanoa ferruginea]REF97866.1 RimJ/RimL family protein N-acetyltransferase [Asanoa ferruginea]GIF52551.1 N-acetyltransferase [Asanoa ferruginea]
MTVFETDRLVVRQWTESDTDVARVFDMLSRWEVARWLGAQPRVLETEDEALAAIRRWRGRASADGLHGVWAVDVRDTGTTAGSVLVVPLPGVDSEPSADIEVGWHLHPDSWGHGYATESAAVAIERVFAAGLPEIYAVIREGNTPSTAVARRLGMSPIGIQRRWYGGIELDTYRLAANDR